MDTLIDNRYRVIEPLGEGAMGTVYLVEDTLTRQQVALKVIKHDAKSRSALQLQQEFRLQTKLRHPHCCEVYSYGTLSDGTPYFTMEVVRGKDLDELLPLDLEQFRQVFAQLLLALGYVHQQGFVHRDLKPANVRLRADGTLKLMDFGLMERAGQPGEAIAGTVPYLSPEMIRRSKLDQRSDLYSLGALAYELLTGQPPFVRPTPIEAIRAHLGEPPSPPSSLRTAIPPLLDMVLLKLLAKDPLERFQSAEEVLAALGHEASAGIGGTLLSSPLLGREEELARLHGKLDRLSAQSPGEALLLWGPEGVGKSRLLEELRFSCELSGTPYAMGKAYESGNFPYRHFVWVLRGLLPALKEHVPQELDRLAPVLVKLLPELGVPAAADMEPSQEKLRLQSAVTDVLRALSQVRGFVITLENWQWAEPLSIELLEHLLRNLQQASILLLVASRLPHDQQDTELSRLQRLQLAPLDAAACHQMLRAMLGSQTVDPAFLEAVTAVTGGNPLKVENLLDRLVKAGQLAREKGRWTLPKRLEGDGSEDALAEAVLTAPALAVCRAGAVIGPAFELSVLRRVANLPDDALFDALAELVAAQVLQPGDHGSYGFSQDRYRTHFYAQVGPEARHTLHFATLHALESQLDAPLPDAPLEQLVALARHALIAGATEQAIAYTLEAGTRAARLFAIAEANELLSAGLRQVSGGNGGRWRHERLRFLHALGDLRRVAGDHEGARTAYLDAAPLARELEATATAGRLLTSLAKTQQTLGQLDEALATCEQALAAALSAGVHVEAARCLNTTARIHFYQGRTEAAVVATEACLQHAREANSPAQIGTALGFLGYLRAGAGVEGAAEGIAMMAEAVTMLNDPGDKLNLLALLDLLGDARLKRGDWADARATYHQRQALCAELGTRQDEAITLVNLAVIALEEGDFAAASATARAAGDLAVRIGYWLPLCFARLLEGLAAVRLGQLARGEKLGAEAEAIAAERGSQYVLVEMLPHMAALLLYLGRIDEARDLIERLSGAASPTVAALLEGELRYLEGAHEDAEAALARAVETARAESARGLLARALLGRARALVTLQRWEEAAAAVDEGLALTLGAGMRGRHAEFLCLRGELDLAYGERSAGERFTELLLASERPGYALLRAQALFGQAASDAYDAGATRLVEKARRLLTAFLEDVSEQAQGRFLVWPERQRLWTGNHIDFGLARARKRVTGPLQPPGMWR